jgi:hypothetical protein
MSKGVYLRQLLGAALLGFVVAACTHKPSPSDQLRAAFAPFSNTRAQTEQIVAYMKRTLAAADINTLSVAYTRFEEKANAYTSFMVEAVTSSSFDPAKNTQYSGDFEKAITNFNKTLVGLNSRRTLSADWVPSFAQSLQTNWNQYSGALAKMTPQQKADFVTELKRDTVWPNYEDIATEPVGSSSPKPR